MLLVLAGILTAAMVIQFADREIPCPLCLLERVAMFGCCFGLIQQLRSDGSQRGAEIGLVFSVLLLVISARQTLLDLFPRPGHAYVGGAVFGVHMPVWSESSSRSRSCLDSRSDWQFLEGLGPRRRRKDQPYAV